MAFCGTGRCNPIASDCPVLSGQFRNLRNDLGEPRNLKAEESDRVAAMTQLLHRVLTPAGGGLRATLHRLCKAEKSSKAKGLEALPLRMPRASAPSVAPLVTRRLL